MTERKHFKQLVRARVAKTGESYSTARRQILRQAPDSPRPIVAPHHFPGSMPVPTALRAILAAAGVRHPGTKEPFSEAMVFGFAGGIGAGMFAFHYAKENFSSFYVAGRHEWWDDAHWGQSALERLGIKFLVKESGGAKAGEKQLRDLLAGDRPVMAWVDSASLPYRALPDEWKGGGYHVVTVHRIDDATSTALVGDLADEPIAVPLADLAVARARIKKFKHRLLAVEPADTVQPLRDVVRSSIEACVRSLVTCTMKNYTLESLANWADKLDGSKAADAWAKIFPPGPLLYQGLRSVTEYIEFYGTGGGLCRPMFAEFLEESGKSLKDGRLTGLAERYAELGTEWSDLALAALPSGVPAFRRTEALLRGKWELIHTEAAGATEAIGRCWKELNEIGQGMKNEFPLSQEQSTELRRELKRRVTAIYEKEKAALAALRTWLG